MPNPPCGNRMAIVCLNLPIYAISTLRSRINNAGKYREAIPYLTNAIEFYGRNSNGADAYCARGRALAELGEYDKAIADENQALAINLSNALAYNNRGSCWDAKKEYDKAIA